MEWVAFLKRGHEYDQKRIMGNRSVSYRLVVIAIMIIRSRGQFSKNLGCDSSPFTYNTSLNRSLVMRTFLSYKSEM